MEVITLVSLIALVNRVVSVIKSAIAKDWNTPVTQALTWVVGIAVLFLAASADITAGLVIFDGVPALGDLDNGSVVLVGLSYASGASLVYEVKKAIDTNDSAAEPKLLKAKTA